MFFFWYLKKTFIMVLLENGEIRLSFAQWAVEVDKFRTGSGLV